MTMGPWLTFWSARLAFLLYGAGLAAWLTGRTRTARWVWTLGLLVLLGHVAAAFEFYHHWSHQAAYEATAQQTAERIGIRWGGGLFWNYLFTGVWAVDVVWSWWSAESYRRRPRWVTGAIHGYLAFLFFQATVVFGTGWIRWLGLAVSIALAGLWWRSRSGLQPKQARRLEP